jgi:hypothetical protein
MLAVYSLYMHFPCILCGCETWSLSLRGDHKLMLFGNPILRRIFHPKRDEVTGGWRKLYNEAFRKFCCSIYVITVYGSAVLLLYHGRFFTFLNLYTVGRTPWTGDQPVARPLPTQNNTNTE